MILAVLDILVFIFMYLFITSNCFLQVVSAGFLMHYYSSKVNLASQALTYFDSVLWSFWFHEMRYNSLFHLKAHSQVRQFLAIESPLKMMNNAFYFTSEALFVLKIFKFLSWPFGRVTKQLDEKDQANFKFYDVTAGVMTSNTHIAQYF